MTDSGQNIVNKYAYTPFGIIANKVEAVETVPQPFTFVGQFGVMTEPEGFYYMRARYYDPSIGRFISEDPSGFEGGDVNLYGYAGNNPINFIDPYGLASKSFTENFNSNVTMTNGVIFGDHIKTIIGFATSGSVAKTIGTVTPLQVLINLAKTGEVSITNMTALGTLGSAALNMAMNSAVVSIALEAGIYVGSGINALYQTYVQSDCVK